MNDKEQCPFGVNINEGKYQVVDDSERTWLETSNAVSAEHYVDLLNKAFNSGFKKGVRKVRLNQ